jgi:heme/copper-type cytochrome/quinol oxidase subunit 2
VDLISILTTTILATTIGTIIVGVAAYAAFKLRDKRKPTKKASAEGGTQEEAVFFKRYVPTPVDASGEQATKA